MYELWLAGGPDAKTIPNELKIRVNERVWTIESRPDTPLLYVLQLI